MLKLTEDTRIYVAADFVDFRKAINGLSALVAYSDEVDHRFRRMLISDSDAS